MKQNMLDLICISAQKQQLWRWIIMVLLTLLLLQVVLIVPSAIETVNLYIYKTDRHYVFGDINELNFIRSIKLQSVEKDVVISDVKISEKRQYTYDEDKVALYAYKLEDGLQMHKLVEKLVGETYGTRVKSSEEYRFNAFLNKAEYFIYSGDSLLIVRTRFGAEKLNEIIMILDEKLSEVVKS